MTEKIAVSRDAKEFKNRVTYRELTYKLASRLLEDGEVVDAELEAKLWAEAKEPPPLDEAGLADLLKEAMDLLGLADYETIKVDTYLVPTTLNSVMRGIAKKGDREVRFYIERP